jgi:two-component system sensor histidine kinase TctE
MGEGLERAERTANQLLALARARDAGALDDEPEQTDLVALAHDIVRAMYPTARARRQDLGLDCPLEPVWLAAPEWLVREALGNIVHNALRYTQPGGVITISVRGDDAALRVVVEDNGPGMTADDIAKAGIRFRRGKAGRNTSGAGLGLAIVNAIMQQLHGEFLLESEGRGCRAILVFTLDSTGDGQAQAK